MNSLKKYKEEKSDYEFYQKIQDIENRNQDICQDVLDAENLQSIAFIIKKALDQLKITLSHLSKGDLECVVITKENAISQYNKFVENILLSINKHCKSKIQIKEILIEHPTISLKEFKKHCTTSSKNILDVVAKNVSVSVLSHKFQIDPLDIKKQKLNAKEYKKKALNFDCVRYAFYKIHEPKVESWVYGKTDQNPFSDIDTILTTLIKEFDYSIVHDAREGDLIVYINEFGRPIHF